ncbi:Gp37-like protein [Rhodococcoides fascians]|uniref:Gp37-like protein n=1 Tax=Rhodococcoides fascians TaxID=1828 RepID=UPI0005672B9C|nr:hypothetical protein [Rhodococcus fascians]
MINAPGYANPNATPKEARDIQIGVRSSDRRTIDWTPLGGYKSSTFEFDWYEHANFEIHIKPDHRLLPFIKTRNGRPKRAIFVRTEENGITQTYRLMKRRHVGVPGREDVVLSGFDHRFYLQRGLDWVNNLFPPEFQISLTGKQHVTIGEPDIAFKLIGAGVWTRLNKPIFSALPLHQVTTDLPDLDDIDTLDDLVSLADGWLANVALISTRFTRLDEAFANTRNRLDFGYKMDVWDGYGTPPTVFNTSSLSQLQSVIDATSDNFLKFTNPNNYLGLADPASWNRMPRAGYIFDTVAKRDMRHIQWRTDGGQISHIDYEINEPDLDRITVGGKAPEILNQVIEWGANFAIQLLLNAIAPGLGLGFVVGDLFDNIFFAYQSFYDSDLANEVGQDDSWGEGWGDNTNAYSLDSYSIAQEKLEAGSGNENLNLTVDSGNLNGNQFGADDDSGKRYNLGDVHTFYDQGTTTEQYVSHVVCADDLTSGRRTQVPSFGKNPLKKVGVTSLLGNLQSLASYSRGNSNSV